MSLFNCIFSIFYQFLVPWVSSLLKWISIEVHFVQHHSTGKYVNWRSLVIRISIYHFRCHITWSTTFCSQKITLFSVEEIHQTKISKFELHFISEKAILKLDISVNNSFFMSCFNCSYQLIEDLLQVLQLLRCPKGGKFHYKF